jgi:hypothetical protein
MMDIRTTVISLKNTEMKRSKQMRRSKTDRKRIKRSK